MNKKIAYLLTALVPVLAALLPLTSFAQYYWENETGGVYNIPAVEYNPTYTGFGSDGDLIYNKIDLQTGETMQIVTTANLYDYLGNQVATAWASAIGWNHETEFRDGGIIASSIAEIKVEDTIHTMVYAWSVNTKEGGRRSGWIKLSDLSPSSSIENILNTNKSVRMNILRAGGIEDASYDEYEVIAAVLPDEAEEYYLDPGRAASFSAGKARYYYTRDDYISGIKNIPETNRQRYGVAHNNIPLNAKFYRDMSVDTVDVSIYPPSSTTAIDHTLMLVWGYTITSADEKIYSWINERTLSATGVTVDREFTPDPDKLYYIDNPAQNLRLASTGESEDAYTTSIDSTGNDVLWQFVAKGNDYWHIQRAAGGSKPRLRSDNSSNADMQATSSNGIYTYYHFPVSTTSGNYYASLLDGPTSYRRLQIDNSGSVNMVSDGSTDTSVSFEFTEATEAVTENIAPEGTASQVSTGWGGLASRAIDGNTNGTYSQRSVTHTKNQYKPWWQVQWGSDYVINEIKIHNRTNSCCTSRLTNFTVYVLDNSGNVTFSKSYTTSPNPSLTIDAEGVTGRTVKVQLDDTNALSLAEVEVFGYR